MTVVVDRLLRRVAARSRARWWVLLAMALAVVFGTTDTAHDDVEEATVVLAVLDPLDFEPSVKPEREQGNNGKKAAKAASPDQRTAGADKLDVPQGVLGRAAVFRACTARSEPPMEPLPWRPPLPQPERLLRPPNA